MFSTLAFAEVAANSHTSMTAIFPQALLLIGFGIIFYSLIWRPQAKRAQEHHTLLAGLEVGDIIYTTGGMVGKIIKLQGAFLKIEIAPNTQIYIQKEAVANIVPTDSIKFE